MAKTMSIDEFLSWKNEVDSKLKQLEKRFDNLTKELSEVDFIDFTVTDTENEDN